MVIALRRPSPGVISSPFGMRAGGLHEGIDFGWGNGWTIYAAAAGVVRWAAPGAGYGARYGNLTIINHGGFETRYAHQSQMWVRPGYQVAAGEGIGLIGGSGERGLNTYAPHLHFELLIGGKRVNPAPYFASTAGGGVTPIPTPIPEVKKKRRRNMATLYNYNGTQLWALAGDSPGTSANWIEMTDVSVVDKLVSQQFGDGAVKLTPATWDAWKKRYLEPTTGAGVPFDYAELGKALALAVSANAPVPSAADIARAVNDDAAERLRN